MYLFTYLCKDDFAGISCLVALMVVKALLIGKCSHRGWFTERPGTILKCLTGAFCKLGLNLSFDSSIRRAVLLHRAASASYDYKHMWCPGSCASRHLVAMYTGRSLPKNSDGPSSVFVHDWDLFCASICLGSWFFLCVFCLFGWGFSCFVLWNVSGRESPKTVSWVPGNEHTLSSSQFWNYLQFAMSKILDYSVPCFPGCKMEIIELA